MVNMDAFNRLLVVLLALAVLAAAVAIFLVAADISKPSAVAPDGWLQDQLREIDQLGGDRKAASIASAVAGAVVAVILLILQALPVIRVERLVVADIDGKDFGIYRESIESLIERAGVEIEGVTAVRSALRQTPEGLQINCLAMLEPTAKMPEVGADLQTKVKDVVESMAGVTVAEVRMKLRYGAPEPEPKQKRRVE
jgi:uncharacterized alkaline shock family protein YloU